MKRVNNVNSDLNLKATATAYNNLVSGNSAFSTKLLSDCGGYLVVVGRRGGYEINVQAYDLYKDEVIYSATFTDEMECSWFYNMKHFKGFDNLYNALDNEITGKKVSNVVMNFAKYILMAVVGLTDKNAVDLLKSRKDLKTTVEERQFLHRGFEMFSKSERKWLAINLFTHLL